MCSKRFGRKDRADGRTGRKDRADGRTGRKDGPGGRTDRAEGRTDGPGGRTDGPGGRKDPPHPPKNYENHVFLRTWKRCASKFCEGSTERELQIIDMVILGAKSVFGNL